MIYLCISAKRICESIRSSNSIYLHFIWFWKVKHVNFNPVKRLWISRTEQGDIAIIDANAYCKASLTKKTQVFHISLKNLEYQAEKTDRHKTGPTNVVLANKHDFFDGFFKWNLDIVAQHRKYNEKIILDPKSTVMHWFIRCCLKNMI